MKTGCWFANILKKKNLERLLRLSVCPSVPCLTLNRALKSIKVNCATLLLGIGWVLISLSKAMSP